jgi:hypothetical protein
MGGRLGNLSGVPAAVPSWFDELSPDARLRSGRCWPGPGAPEVTLGGGAVL